jgi:hypothetical protein
MRPRPRAENLEDEAGAIDHLAFPGFFEIALLHRADRRVDDGDLDRLLLDDLGEAVDGALAQKRRRPRLLQADDLRMDDIEVDRLGEADSFREPRLGRARALAGALQRRMEGNCAPGRSLSAAVSGRAVFLGQASPPSFGSNSCTGAAGITVEIACL